MAHDIGHNRRDIRTRREDSGEALERQATDGHQWDRPDTPLPLRDPLKALRRPGHDLQQRRIDRTEGHVVGLQAECARQLALVVRADTEAHAGAPQGWHIDTIQIPLPEADEIAARLHRELPVVVDDELQTGGCAALARLADLKTQRLLRLFLHTHPPPPPPHPPHPLPPPPPTHPYFHSHPPT